MIESFRQTNENPLREVVDSFLESICDIESLLFQRSAHLKARQKTLIGYMPQYAEDRPVMASGLILGDLTEPSNNGWKINYAMGHGVEVYKDELIESVNSIIQREAMRDVAMGYEVLESYLFDIIAVFLSEFSEYQVHVKLSQDKFKTMDQAKESIRKYYRSRNNKKLLSLLRKISREYSNAERNNTEKINLNDWYSVLSHVRHAVVHSVNVLKNYKEKLSRGQVEILKKHFSIVETGSYDARISMSLDDSRRQLKIIAEFGLLIFKTLSQEVDAEWKFWGYFRKN